MSSSNLLFALLGPTASGKTALALDLAQRYPFEVISVDSALVYRGMDIGTAKPSVEERRAVTHHLIDICSPLEHYSAAQFVQDTLAAIQDIETRGRWPLLVGGTFLYVNALVNGLNDLPEADPAYRAKLDTEAGLLGWPALHKRLAEYDPVTAARLHPTDKQRIQRALEVFYLTGRPLSEALTERHSPLQRTPIIMGLDIERSLLHTRIAQRFQHMVQQGFLDEVNYLKKIYPLLHPNLPSMRCVGYRQAWEYLAGLSSASQWQERGIVATRQLAKRQITWMRHFPGTHLTLFNAASPQVFNELTDFIDNLLSNVEIP